MTCKDCISYEACKFYNKNLPEEYDPIEWQCDNFKDKSRFIELPCKVGDNFFIITQRFEKGKYTDFFIDKKQVTHFEYNGKILIIYDFEGMSFVYDFEEMGFVLDDIYFDKSKAETKLKELNGNES